MSEGPGQVANAAPALHLRFQDATTASQMVGQGRQHLQCCNWLQVQHGSDVDGPAVASRPPHDEAHRPRVAGIHLHDLDLERGRQKNVSRRRSSNLFRRRSGDVLAVFSAIDWNTAGAKCCNVAGTGPRGERHAFFFGPNGPYGMQRRIPAFACPRCPSGRLGPAASARTSSFSSS